MPAADEVSRLQTGSDPECRLAQGVFEKGHYGGRTQPTNTRQGTYALTPSGMFLASINSNDPKAMAGMLRKALDRWSELKPEERLRTDNPASAAGEIRRAENRRPADGLVLRVFVRDLPRTSNVGGWRENAWNQDYLWYRKAEVSTMVPSATGQSLEWPQSLVHRLVRFNLVDHVRGQTTPHPADAIEKARIESRVVAQNGGRKTLSLSGEARVVRKGTWPIAGYADMNSPTEQTLGVDVKMEGYAVFDEATQRFTSFELVAHGTRWGATQYNGRHDDTGEHPIGFLLTLAGNTAAERVAPAHFWGYGW